MMTVAPLPTRHGRDRTIIPFTQALLQAVHRSLCSRDRGLWVVDASGLIKADFFGKSDPYAKVLSRQQLVQTGSLT